MFTGNKNRRIHFGRPAARGGLRRRSPNPRRLIVEPLEDRQLLATIVELTDRIAAPDPGWNDQYGRVLAIDGEWAIVGAWLDNPIATDSGSAYLYHRNAGSWEYTQKLVPADGGYGHHFGYSVDIDDDLLVVGAESRGAGAAYVYRRSGTTWSYSTTLTASDGSNDFGASVSIDGDFIAVGAEKDGAMANGAGAAYVFHRTGTDVWTQEAKLVASYFEWSEHWGRSIAIDDGAVILGNNGADEAAIFERSGAGTWAESAHLLDSDGIDQDFFGWSVDIQGDRAVVGTPGYWGGTSPWPILAGSAYVFEKSGGVWSQTQKLTASDGRLRDYFGGSVALSGETILVGAQQDCGFRLDKHGSAYLFGSSAESVGSWV